MRKGRQDRTILLLLRYGHGAGEGHEPIHTLARAFFKDCAIYGGAGRRPVLSAAPFESETMNTVVHMPCNAVYLIGRLTEQKDACAWRADG